MFQGKTDIQSKGKLNDIHGRRGIVLVKKRKKHGLSFWRGGVVAQILKRYFNTERSLKLRGKRCLTSSVFFIPEAEVILRLGSVFSTGLPRRFLPTAYGVSSEHANQPNRTKNQCFQPCI